MRSLDTAGTLFVKYDVPLSLTRLPIRMTFTGNRTSSLYSVNWPQFV